MAATPRLASLRTHFRTLPDPRVVGHGTGEGLHVDLSEGVIDIRVRSARGSDDAHFGERGNAASHAVESAMQALRAAIEGPAWADRFIG